MLKLSDRELIEAYNWACHLNLELEFITLLEIELNSRGIVFSRQKVNESPSN
jgi:hypothetical protein